MVDRCPRWAGVSARAAERWLVVPHVSGGRPKILWQAVKCHRIAVVHTVEMALAAGCKTAGGAHTAVEVSAVGRFDVDGAGEIPHSRHIDFDNDGCPERTCAVSPKAAARGIDFRHGCLPVVPLVAALLLLLTITCRSLPGNNKKTSHYFGWHGRVACK
ncbi:MAG: hypothetical protein Q7S66_02415 [bacterium]|nr:hypothetical protein [bacterium]